MGIHIQNIGTCQCFNCGTILPETTKPTGKKTIYRITQSTYLGLGAKCSYIQADIDYFMCQKCEHSYSKAFKRGCLLSLIIVPIVFFFAYEFIGDVFISVLISSVCFFLVSCLFYEINKKNINKNDMIGVNAAWQFLKENGWNEVEPRGDSGVLRDSSDKNMDYYGILSLEREFDVRVIQ